MKFLTSVALLATAAVAAPSDKLFNLKTSGASNSTHNDLYLTVGRGVVPDPLNSEAVFSGVAANRAATFYFANSTIYWNAHSSAPYALDLINVDGVRKERAQISVDPTHGSKGFSITPEGVKGPSETWEGWLWCPVDAEAGQFFPNLHFLNKNVQEPAVPAGCDKINLQAVPRS
ncbi:unnamed protein product [Penicillium olsonii]|uniref:DUF7907 domain-containing protein n=1 Tax=Penicillium olsonii TaxID=99116 RepID=A0A9W4HAX5_PENOL|nr:unnamed protein product [Penicillium olsonii]CAG8066241.1 unnamed protein product [Penicillium olsonii]CAG8208129.1 unnamed protein product [Penicillium olsonii]